MPQRFCDRAISHHALYDLAQWLAGAARVRGRLMPLLAGASSLLDIGAGTGGIRAYLPPACRYLWMDMDPAKLRGFRPRPGDAAVLGSALALPLAPGAVDRTLCMAVAHHLEDEQLSQALREIARVSGKLVLLDPIACPGRPLSRLLWSIDRGSFPRTPETLRRFLDERFVVERAETFTVLHRYFLCVARPR